MIKNLETIKLLIRTHCPEQEHILDNSTITSFFECLPKEFETLNLEERFNAKGLYCGIDFIYPHPLVFWTRTGIDFTKRYEGELFADFFIDGKTLTFEAAALSHIYYDDNEDVENIENDDNEDEDVENNNGIIKNWPVQMLETEPKELLEEVLKCFKSFYQKYQATQNW